MNKDKTLLELIYISIGVWFILLSYRVLKIFLSIRAIKEDRSFYVSLNLQSVQISQKLTPWEHYKFYIEHDNYLEIHDIENNISFLPKTSDIDEIISFTKKRITKKI
ncbi:hypothetical protein OO007_02310 [Cocleimonas sp. KMM 6892]|uniref:hypothetical protein n=1 Tax=unclassified Cocleimonas TaxID=2639732 RepID=UPI002DBB7F1B|nr:MULTISPECIES: hypothetical protein [unclassified Cocleimonas]MEB8431043.1 hypothetical protein [Cocleimonas sp. KMM 6892]MEC4714185.1 hypothetical protein [Cocleimonas sp. KMM 6895]MEC4743516.1 hypothetical protein [Cocleimonas sp. KMM 6896]